MKAQNERLLGEFRLRPLLVGVLTAIVSGAACMLAAAGLMTALDVSPAIVTVLSMFSSMVGAFFGGMVAARMSGMRGWFYGLLCGAFLFMCILLAGLLLHRGIDVGFLFIKLPLLLVSSMVGGMIGVNKK